MSRMLSMFQILLLNLVCKLEAAVLLQTAHYPAASRDDEKKPKPLFTFQAQLRTASGSFQHVTSDAERLAIAVRDEPSYIQGSEDTPHDSTIFDFANARQFNRQRFFGETVCFMIDMPADDAPDGLSSPLDRTAYLESGFRSAVGQFLGAPLQLYDSADEFQGELEYDGQSCYSWTSRQVSDVELVSLAELQDLQLAKLGVNMLRVESLLAAVQEFLEAGRGGPASLATNATFCVAATGEVLTTSLTNVLTLKEGSSNGTHQLVLWSNRDQTNATFKHGMAASSSVLNATFAATGGRCLDLTSGHVGPSELRAHVNNAERLARINFEAQGHWHAHAYDLWDDTVIEETVPALGTKIRPLRLPLRHRRHSHLHIPGGGFVTGSAMRPKLPSKFDAREHWPDCVSIGMVRNQGPCGSCWAFAAVTVLADRFCIATQSSPGKVSLLDMTLNASTARTLQGLHLAPEHLIDCDGGNDGCQGGRLDSVWWYLRDHGVPAESCTPYRYCPLPNERHCAYGESEADETGSPSVVAEDTAGNIGSFSSSTCTATCEGPDQGIPMQRYRASIAYAVAAPSDISGLQRELFTHGPVEVGFFVFSDFHSYRDGVYFRTPGAYGPLGGHAVRLLGWGKSSTDYWLAANSWSPQWGLGGFFKIRRGTNECGIESTPAAGLPLLGDSAHNL